MNAFSLGYATSLSTQVVILKFSTLNLELPHSGFRSFNSCVVHVWCECSVCLCITLEVSKIPIGGHSPSQMHGLQTKLVELGHLYSRSERYFPLDYLVQLLEQNACRQDWEAGFVYQTLLEVGVAITTLFSIYDRLFKAKVQLLCVCVCVCVCGGGGGEGTSLSLQLSISLHYYCTLRRTLSGRQ